MKFAKTLTSIAIALFGVVVLVSASRYGSNNNYISHNNNNNNRGYGGPLAANNYLLSLTGGHHGPNYGGCRGYNCNSNLVSSGNSHRGPYHSYSVRPAIYGGHGMYHYRGYARTPQQIAHYRPAGSYNAPCNGYPNCNSRGNLHHTVRPIKALLLVPINNPVNQYRQRPQQQHQQPSHYRVNHRHNNGHRNSARNNTHNRNQKRTRHAGRYTGNNNNYGNNRGKVARHGAQRGHRGASAGGY